jgi:tetratricopeptide (TPR) repeat protein
MLALLYVESGREADARGALEGMGDDAINEAREWTFGRLEFVLALVCAALGDSARSAMLYDILLPSAGLHAASASMYSLGSVSRFLGLLATTLGRLEDAERHFIEALAMNERIGARPYVAHTQHEHAAMLLARGHPEDRDRALDLVNRALATAQELGMRRLEEQALALKVKAQGIVSA